MQDLSKAEQLLGTAFLYVYDCIQPLQPCCVEVINKIIDT